MVEGLTLRQEDLEKKVQLKIKEDSLFSFERISQQNIDGVNGDEDTPVPIPNTEVKLICAYNTWLDTAWKDRSMPSHFSLFKFY